MASSPSEFLTFFRRINTAPTLRQSTRYLAHPSIPRPFTTSLASRKEGEDIGPEKEHTVDKAPKDAHTNVHSHQSKAGRDSRAMDTGGQATTEKDTRNSKAKAKAEFPEAPDVAIGMQDERGGKGW